MPHTSRVSSVVLSLMALSIAGAAACGDDASGTGGAGGGGSASSAGSTTGSPGSSTSSGDTASSSSGDQGGGDAGGGAQGGGGAGGGDAGGGGAGGEAPACTPDDPPEAACDEQTVGQTCQVVVEGGGCPDTSVIWRCTDFEGGPIWNQSIDTKCYCSVENEEEACIALPGCVWAEAPGDTCDEFTFDGTPIGEAGCLREDCGSPGGGLVGLVDETCQDDLCSAFPPD